MSSYYSRALYYSPNPILFLDPAGVTGMYSRHAALLPSFKLPESMFVLCLPVLVVRPGQRITGGVVAILMETRTVEGKEGGREKNLRLLTSQPCGATWGSPTPTKIAPVV